MDVTADGPGKHLGTHLDRQNLNKGEVSPEEARVGDGARRTRVRSGRRRRKRRLRARVEGGMTEGR